MTICERARCGSPAHWRPVLLLFPPIESAFDYLIPPLRMILGLVICDSHKLQLNVKEVVENVGDWQHICSSVELMGKRRPERSACRLTFIEIGSAEDLEAAIRLRMLREHRERGTSLHSLIAAFALALLSTTVFAAPTIQVVYPTASMGLCNEDTSSVVLRVTGDKQLVGANISFDTPIGAAAAGTTFAAKPPGNGGVVEIALPAAIDLWGSTMTAIVTDKTGAATTLVYEYSSVNVP